MKEFSWNVVGIVSFYIVISFTDAFENSRIVMRQKALFVDPSDAMLCNLGSNKVNHCSYKYKYYIYRGYNY